MEATNTQRTRGVRLSDLDRSQSYVIAYTGRRWETVGVVTDAAAVEPVPPPESGAGAEPRAWAPGPGRHSAPAPDAADGHPRP